MKRVILSADRNDNGLRKWLVSMGFDILPIGSRVDSWVDGIVIGGGSDPGIPKDEKRDSIEMELLTVAEKQNVPVLGICRGAEIITVRSGGVLSPIPSSRLSLHQGRWHKVILSELWTERELEVWSHHHLFIESSGTIKPVAYSQDGSIETIADAKKRILGVMWHPERSDQQGYTSIYPWLKWVEKRF